MSKRFTCSIVLGFSLFFGISTPNLKADEEIITEQIDEQKSDESETNQELEQTEEEIITRHFFLEDELEEDEANFEESQNNHSDEDEEIIQEKLTSTQATLQRTLFKSIIETISTHFSHKYYPKTDTKEYKVEKFRYDELGKILSNLLVDETIPNPKSSWSQKLTEFLVPTITAFLIIDCAQESFSDNEKFQSSEHKIKYIISESPKLGSKLFQKLIKKFFMVRFLQKPGTRSFAIADALAIASAFYEFNTSGKTFHKIFLDPSCIKFRHGIEQVVLDRARIIIESAHLPRHRKKALGKIAQLFLKPQLQEIIFEADKYRKSMAS